MKESERLLKNSLIIAIGGISTKMIAFFLLPLYTSILSAQDYGTFDYIISITAFAAPVLSLLVSESMFRFLIEAGDNDEKKKRVISQSILIVIIGIVVGLIIATIFFSIKPVSYAIPLVLYCVTTIISWQMSAVLRGLGRMKEYMIYNLLVSVGIMIVNIITIVVLKWGILGLYVGNIFPSLLISFVFIVKNKLYRYIQLKDIEKSEMKRILHYSIHLVPNKLSWSVVDLSDRIIIMNTMGAGSNGIYSVSNKFPALINTAYGFFYTAWMESSSRILQQSEEEAERFYSKIYTEMKHLLVALTLGMLSFMPLLNYILVNKKYWESYYYIPFLTFGMLFSNLSGIYGGIFIAHKDSKILAYSSILGAILNLVLNMLFINFFGLYAAAGATFLAYLTIYIVRLLQVKKYIHLKSTPKYNIFALIISITIVLMYYSNNIWVYGLSMATSIIFAAFTNKETLMIIIKK